MKFSKLLPYCLYILFMMLLIQSCGVIEKRRYSGGWNLNLNLGTGDVNGKAANKPIKKKTPVNSKKATMPADWSLNADTVDQTEMGYDRVAVNEQIERRSWTVGRKKKHKLLQPFDDDTPHVFSFNDIQIESPLSDVDSAMHVNQEPVKKIEPFALASLICLVLASVGVFGLIFNTYIYIFLGINFIELFIILTIFGFTLALISNWISHFKFKSKRLKGRFNNRNMYVLSGRIMLYLFLAGFATLVILAGSI